MIQPSNTTAKLIAIAALPLLALLAPLSNANNAYESEWIQALKYAHRDNGRSLPINDWRHEESVKINSEDLKKWVAGTNHYQAQRSRLQVSPVNYQADVSAHKLQVRIFRRF
ncbi:MAG: hypothetical protein GYB33_01085 [Gammaproteobacteria bacterium]|uniref:hypothetical protein n=1 Tax=Pseudomaricurvus alcaniphilus TaxID=1166482 RepID=UPI00140A8D38|nr:hypothetical protein [Pseudomaricurvus alcaniphilus]MBR9908926.1 hypothetical protein [Gammaproteobacteria bacterium]NHN37980.1 hypothetical protein [Pseudomaricurvus alcaniphilus]